MVAKILLNVSLEGKQMCMFVLVFQCSWMLVYTLVHDTDKLPNRRSCDNWARILSFKNEAKIANLLSGYQPGVRFASLNAGKPLWTECRGSFALRHYKAKFWHKPRTVCARTILVFPSKPVDQLVSFDVLEQNFFIVT